VRSIESWHFLWPRVTFEGHLGDLLTVVTLCAQLTCDLSAIAKFLVKSKLYVYRSFNFHIFTLLVRTVVIKFLPYITHCTLIHYACSRPRFLRVGDIWSSEHQSPECLQNSVLLQLLEFCVLLPVHCLMSSVRCILRFPPKLLLIFRAIEIRRLSWPAPADQAYRFNSFR